MLALRFFDLSGDAQKTLIAATGEFAWAIESYAIAVAADAVAELLQTN